MFSHIGKQAVVIGAGMGGWRRHVCFPITSSKCWSWIEMTCRWTQLIGRTPQSRHVHAILSGGLRALDEVFVKLCRFPHHLAQAGAVEVDFPLDTRVERGGFDPFPQRKLDIITYCASRPLVEFTTRQLVGQHPNIEFRQGYRVREITATTDGAIVTGVRCETASGQTETIAADLVIDASGRGTLTLELLKSIGRPMPEETSIGMDIGYSTGTFEIPDEFERTWKGLATAPHAPTTSRGAVMLPREGNQWTLTLYGMHGECGGDRSCASQPIAVRSGY